MFDHDAQPLSAAAREPLLGGDAQPGPLDLRAQGPAMRSYYLRLAQPRLLYFFIVANLLMFVATLWVGYRSFGTMNGSENLDVLVAMGAKVNEWVALGETWRLFSAMFLHIGVMHLLFNLYAMYAIGTLVEPYYGSLRFGVIYLLGGLFGSLGSYAFSEAVSAGASGAVFAITGAAAVYFFRYRDNFGERGRALLQNMVVIIVINLAFGIAGSGVDNWGHLGGLVGGALLSWGLLPRYRVPFDEEIYTTAGTLPMVAVHKVGRELVWVALMLLLLGAGVYFTTQARLDQLLQLMG